MIVLIDPRDSTVRIELAGQFADSDAETLLRTFPELRKSKRPEQIPLFDVKDVGHPGPRGR